MSTNNNIPTFDVNGRPFSLNLSPWGGNHDDIAFIPDGYFALPGNTTLKKTDKYRLGRWVTTGCPGDQIKNSNSGMEKYPYIRKISDDPELYQVMQEYASGGKAPVVADTVTDPKELDTLIAETRAALEKLEKKKKEISMLNYRIGEHVVSILKGTVHYISDASEDHIYIDGKSRDSRMGWSRSEFRPATYKEIKAYHEAQKIVEVVVNVTTYKGEYHKGFVKFGCAQISNQLIRYCHDAVNADCGENGNREVEAVQIGKGLFTKDMLRKLAANMID
jgi:hypothetical protein